MGRVALSPTAHPTLNYDLYQPYPSAPLLVRTNRVFLVFVSVLVFLSRYRIF